MESWFFFQHSIRKKQKNRSNAPFQRNWIRENPCKKVFLDLGRCWRNRTFNQGGPLLFHPCGSEFYMCVLCVSYRNDYAPKFHQKGSRIHIRNHILHEPTFLPAPKMTNTKSENSMETIFVRISRLVFARMCQQNLILSTNNRNATAESFLSHSHCRAASRRTLPWLCGPVAYQETYHAWFHQIINGGERKMGGKIRVRQKSVRQKPEI